MAFKTKVLGREALNRRLRELAPKAEEAVEKAKLEVAKEAASRIAAKAPVGSTGDYKASIKGEFQRNNPGKKPFGGEQTKDPDATAVYGEFIWRFLEFGTAPHINGGLFKGTKHPGTARQPHIFPTWRAYRPKALRKIRNAINKAVREAMGK